MMLGQKPDRTIQPLVGSIIDLSQSGARAEKAITIRTVPLKRNKGAAKQRASLRHCAAAAAPPMPTRIRLGPVPSANPAIAAAPAAALPVAMAEASAA